MRSRSTRAERPSPACSRRHQRQALSISCSSSVSVSASSGAASIWTRIGLVAERDGGFLTTAKPHAGPTQADERLSQRDDFAPAAMAICEHCVPFGSSFKIAARLGDRRAGDPVAFPFRESLGELDITEVDRHRLPLRPTKAPAPRCGSATRSRLRAGQARRESGPTSRADFS